jgi:FixJ family two-component response regulator
MSASVSQVYVLDDGVSQRESVSLLIRSANQKAKTFLKAKET